MNCGALQAVSAARVAYKLLVNPGRPVDGGSFRPLTVVVREGSFPAVAEPAPCEWYFAPPGLLIDLVVKALSGAIQDKAAGASHGDSMVIGIGGHDPRTGEAFLLYEPTVGGRGAWRGCDGQDTLINNVNGSLKDVPIEVEETKNPVYLRRYQVRQDSDGPCGWRGGNGIEREYEMEANDAWLSLWFERSLTPAWGLFGGRETQYRPRSSLQAPTGGPRPCSRQMASSCARATGPSPGPEAGEGLAIRASADATSSLPTWPTDS